MQAIDNGRHVRSEMLLFAAGRMGATDRLNLDAIDLKTDHRGRLSNLCSKCLCDVIGQALRNSSRRGCRNVRLNARVLHKC